MNAEVRLICSDYKVQVKMKLKQLAMLLFESILVMMLKVLKLK